MTLRLPWHDNEAHAKVECCVGGLLVDNRTLTNLDARYRLSWAQRYTQTDPNTRARKSIIMRYDRPMYRRLTSVKQTWLAARRKSVAPHAECRINVSAHGTTVNPLPRHSELQFVDSQH